MDKLLKQLPSDIEMLILKTTWKNGIEKKIVWDDLYVFGEAIEDCSTEFWNLDINKWTISHIECAIYKICKNDNVNMMKKIIKICDFYNYSWDDNVKKFSHIIMIKNDNVDIFDYLLSVKKMPLNNVSDILTATFYKSRKILNYLLRDCDLNLTIDSILKIFNKNDLSDIDKNAFTIIQNNNIECKTHFKNCPANAFYEIYAPSIPKLKRSSACIIPKDIY